MGAAQPATPGHAQYSLPRFSWTTGSALGRLLDAASQHWLKDFNAIHPTDLFSAEEDYLALRPFAACFIQSLAHPQYEAFRDLAQLNRRPELQSRLMPAYLALLGKHMQDQPPGRRLLSKNAAFASWAASLMQSFPNARFLICIREAQGALSSQLSSIEPGRQLFALGIAIHPQDMRLKLAQDLRRDIAELGKSQETMAA